MAVKYCNRECQIAHRPQHKKECKQRAAELHEEALFKQPPPPIANQETLVEESKPDGRNIVPVVPEIPESGLPEGWTMEQWEHYGQAWINQQNES